jgi:hypothetical protein
MTRMIGTQLFDLLIYHPGPSSHSEKCGMIPVGLILAATAPQFPTDRAVNQLLLIDRAGPVTGVPTA